MYKKVSPYSLILICLIVLAFFPLDRPSHFQIDETVDPAFHAFPLTVGNWQGTDNPIDERTIEILETRNVLSRIYKNEKGQELHLLLVASEKDRRVAHPPEVCFMSSNYEILEEREEVWKDLDKEIPIRQFTARHERTPQTPQKVVYLYKIGEKLTSNYYAQQIQFAFDNLTRNESKIFLIRLSGTHDESLREFLPQVLNLLSSQS